MNKKYLSGIIKNLSVSVKKYSPEILTGIGITGMITTVVMAVRATPKAVTLLDEEIHTRIINNDRDDDENIIGLIKVPDDKYGEYGNYRLSVKDTIKTTWLCYMPATITGITSIVCLIGASSMNLRRNAALATAYTLSESALKEYQEKVIQSIGGKKETEIRDSIQKDKVERYSASEREIILTECGDTLCVDLLSGRLFKSDINKIKQVINDLNYRMLNEMYISLNEFYYELGLDGTKLGDLLGWRLENGKIEIQFGSQLTKDGKPCLVLDYRVAPQYDYQV